MSESIATKCSPRAWGRVRRSWAWGLAAVALLAAHFGSFDIAHQALQTDSRYYLYFSQRILAGAVPHRDFFDNKPQLASFVGAGLMWAGRMIGSDPLLVVRSGFVLIMAAACGLLFLVFRRMENGRGAGAWLALLLSTAYAVFAVLPATGNVPKPIMALCSSAAALLVFRRRWFWAGVAAAMAMLDWQVGGLVLIGVAAGAFAQSGQRLRNAGLTLLGTMIGLAPAGVYFAANGAFPDAWKQLVGAAFARGAATYSQQSIRTRTELMADVMRDTCPGPGVMSWRGYARDPVGEDRAALSLRSMPTKGAKDSLAAIYRYKVLRVPAAIPVGLAGLIVFPVSFCRAWRRRGSSRDAVVGMLAMLAIYHYGVIGFSLIDFQWTPDLLILLYSLTFFAGVAALTAWRAAARGATWMLRRSNGPVSPGKAAAYLLLVAGGVAIARPSVLRTPFMLGTIGGRPPPTLEDQREVCEQFRGLSRGKKVAVFGAVQMLVLDNQASMFPFIYWNAATHAHYRTSPTETTSQTLTRLLAEARPDLVVLNNRIGLNFSLPPTYRSMTMASRNKAEVLRIQVRTR